jgi:hypothetical protein
MSEDFATLLADALQLIAKRFDEQDARLTRIEARLDAVEARLGRLETQQGISNIYMKRTDRTLNLVRRKLDDHDYHIKRLTKLTAVAK